MATNSMELEEDSERTVAFEEAPVCTATAAEHDKDK